MCVLTDNVGGGLVRVHAISLIMLMVVECVYSLIMLMVVECLYL